MLEQDTFVDLNGYAAGHGLMSERSAQKSGFTPPAGTRVISADNHFVLAQDIWFEHFPQHLKEKAPRVWRDDALGFPQVGFDGKSIYPQRGVALMRSIEQVPSTWDFNRRLQDLDDEGVEMEVAFPQSPMFFVQHPDFEFREWIFRAYNRYVADLQRQHPTRFVPVPVANYWDMSKAASTVYEIAGLGLKTLMVPMAPGLSVDGSTGCYGDMHFDPFWSAVEETGLPMCFHIGEAVGTPGPAPAVTEAMKQMGGGAGMFRRLFAELIFGGVFDRHPRLKIFFGEGGLHWVPGCLQDAELLHDSMIGLYDYKPKMRPSHYWYRHCGAGFMTDPIGLSHIDQIGVETAMWSADYGHNEGTFGYTRDSVKAVFDTLDEQSARMVVGENAIRMFNL